VAITVSRSLISVDAKQFGSLLTRLVADSGEARDDAAQTAVDWESPMSDFQKRLVIRVLPSTATAERPGPVRESQLNAISKLLLPPFTTKVDVAPLFEIPAGSLNKGDVDYLDGLPEALAEFPDGATESG
jgi:hypothetical protein